MRTLTYIKLIALGALLLAAGLVVREVRRQTDPENVRRSLLAALAGAVLGDVQIGSARFGLDGIVEAEQIAVSAPDAEEPLLQCERVAAQMDRGQLLRGRKVVSSVRMEGLTVRLRRSPERRRWNLADLQPPRPEGRGRPAGPLPERITVENATLLVEYPRLLRDAEPARYEGLYLEFERDRAVPGSWSFDGSLRRGPLRGTRLRGHFAVGSPLRLLVEVQAESLEVGRELLRLIPFGDKVWADYRPQGVTGVEGVVSTDTDGSLGYDFSVAVRDASFLTRFVGAPVEAASGTVLVSDRGVRVEELFGTVRLAEPDAEADLPASVRVEADHRWNGEGHYVIRATDLPLRRTILQAIPSRGEEIWRRLRPEGRGDLHLILDRRRGDAPMQYRAVANVHRATLRPEELPLPLSEVEGVVSVDGDSVFLRDVHGLVRQTTDDGPPSVARVRVDGTVGTRSGALDLNVRADNLRIDESVLKAIPHAGERIWSAARPEGVVDAQVHLERSNDEEALQHRAQVSIEEGRALLEFWPVPLQDVSGTFRLDGDELQLEGMAATIALEEAPRHGLPLNRARLSGTVDLSTGAARLSLSGDNLTLNEELVTSLPAVGQRIWEEARPEGLASFNGTLSYERERPEPVRCILELDLHDVALSPRAVPMPIHAVRGRALISEKRLVADDLTAVSCSGGLQAALVAYYGTEGEMASYAGTVRFRELELAELADYWLLEPPQVGGLLSGTVDVGGVLGGGTPVSMEGTVSLMKGRLWQTPFFVRLLNVLHLQVPSRGERLQDGTTRFTRLGGETTIHEFEVTGGGLQLSGYGRIGPSGSLTGTMVAVGTPEEGGGIPIISSLVGWAMRGVERELLRVEVGGTLQEPSFRPETLARIMAPIAGLRSLLLSPFGEE